MTELRENLLDRIIRIYGFEHKITIWFAKMCEIYSQDNKVIDKILELIVKCNELTQYPNEKSLQIK